MQWWLSLFEEMFLLGKKLCRALLPRNRMYKDYFFYHLRNPASFINSFRSSIRSFHLKYLLQFLFQLFQRSRLCHETLPSLASIGISFVEISELVVLPGTLSVIRIINRQMWTGPCNKLFTCHASFWILILTWPSQVTAACWQELATTRHVNHLEARSCNNFMP